MARDISALTTVAQRAHDVANARDRLELEAAAWVDKKVLTFEGALEEAVVSAVEDGHSVTAVARAYTISGKTPNRNKIYDILKKYADDDAPWSGDYPFEWTAREVKRASGSVTVYDVHGDLSDFGPLEVSGYFMWRYDRATGELDEVLDGVEDPYPIGTKYYKQVLDRWLVANPYPEGN